VLAVLSVGATGFVRWSDLLACGNLDSCKGLSLTHFLDGPVPPWTLRKVVAAMQLVFFGVWWCLSAAYTLPYVRRGLAMRRFCADTLGLADEDVATETLPAVMKRLATVCGAAPGREVPLVAEMYTRFLRRENYWTALYTCNSLREWRLGPGPLDLSDTAILYLVLDTCCVQSITSPEFVTSGKLLPATTIRRRIWFCAAVLLVALPFMLPFLVTRGVLKYMPEVHLHRTHPRGFTHWATWTMRDFNEPWIALETRRARAANRVETYLNCFAQPVVHAVVGVVVMVARFALGLLIVLAVVDEDILGSITVGAHSLLWCMGVLTAVMALAPPTKTSDTDVDGAFAKMCGVFHFAEQPWLTAPHGFPTAAAIRRLFPLRILDAATEAAAIVAAPATLVAATANLRRIEALVASLRALSTRYENDVGVVCRPAAEAVHLDAATRAFGVCEVEGEGEGESKDCGSVSYPSMPSFSSFSTPLAMESALRDKVTKGALAFEIAMGTVKYPVHEDQDGDQMFYWAMMGTAIKL
jgi:hypothetical protein